MDALKILPQAFFDLIARVVPGLVALLLLAWFEPSTWDAITTTFGRLTGKTGTELSLWLLLGAAYVVGHLLSPVTKSVQWITERYPRVEGEGDKKKRFWLRVNTKSELKKFKPDSSKYDWLRVHWPDAGGLSAKLRAEFTLYNTLSAIFFLFAVWVGARYRWAGSVAVLLLFSIMMAARGRETEDTMRKCVDNFEKAAKEVLKSAPPKLLEGDTQVN